MGTLIGAVLMLIAAYQIYRVWRALKAGDRTHVRVPDHWIRERDLYLDADQRSDPPGDQAAPQTRAETREGELSRELLAGHIDAATYQQRMSELAHTTTEAGGSR
jgi:hypothetical protein